MLFFNDAAIGRHVDVTEKKQQLKATMWLAEGYPLSLSDQLLPIVELMALNNTHFDKLKDFLTLQVPAGFPVKIGMYARVYVHALVCFCGHVCAFCVCVSVLARKYVYVYI